MMTENKITPLKIIAGPDAEAMEGFPAEGIDEQKVNKLLRARDKIGIAFTDDGRAIFMAQIKESGRDEIMTFPEPNPVQIYFRMAVATLNGTPKYKEHLRSINRDFVYSKYEAFIDYFEHVTVGIVSLVMAIEAFINQHLPDAKTYPIDGKQYNKNQVMWQDLSFKIKKVLPIDSGIDYHQRFQTNYGRVISLCKLRNDLVHLKDNADANYTFYNDIYERTLNFKAENTLQSCRHFINTFSPGMITDDDGVKLF